jgi:hypothetical protein
VASGNDARFLLSKESTYGTRVLPARAVAINGESMTYEYNRYYSPALGAGRWTNPSVVTTSGGAGSFNGDVPTTGFGFILDGLHNNTVVPVQDGATASYTGTHTLDTAPAKSYSVQVQTPPVSSSTLVPQDLLGVMFSSITFSWDPASVLKYSVDTVVRALDLSQSLATYSAPTSWQPLSFSGGSLTIGGSTIADITGSGQMQLNASLRTDGYALGSSGLMSKPSETAKPSATGNFTADFNDITHLNRVINNTIADVVLKFEGATIASTFKYTLQVTIPNCAFTSPRPTVDGPGIVNQPVTFTNAAGTSTPPVIVYRSTDVAN